MVLSKRVTFPSDMTMWKMSAAYFDIISFVEGVNMSIKGKIINDQLTSSDNIKTVIILLERMHEQIEKIQLLENPQRYGNKAFNDYYTWLCSNAYQLIEEILVPGPDCYIDELATYLSESVGNSVRIDYGTGHELTFIAFIIGLFKIGFLKKPDIVEIRRPSPKSTELNDYAATALHVLPVYLKLVRHLQCYFRMEPAGSRGSWCLDDFQFIPYLWGSSQFRGTGLYEPSQLSDREIASKEASSFLFYSCINHIYQVKTGPFAEHSSCLQSLCEIPHWEKVNSGMIKMYKGEVLGKFPIIQHFLFGNMLQYEPAPGTVVGTSQMAHLPQTNRYPSFGIKPTNDP